MPNGTTWHEAAKILEQAIASGSTTDRAMIIGELARLQFLAQVPLVQSPKETDDGALLTPEQVSSRWGVKKSFVMEQARSHQMKCIHVGKYIRFRIRDVEAFEQGGERHVPRRRTLATRRRA